MGIIIETTSTMQNQNPELRRWLEEIRAIEQEEKLLESNRLELSFRKGRLLKKVKDRLPHGQFLPFLKDGKLKINERNAQRMMKLAANEAVIRSNTTDLSYLTVEKAMAIIKKEKKKTEPKNILVPVSTFQTNYCFNAERQEYALVVHISAYDIQHLSHKRNQQNILKSVKEVLKQMQKQRALTDISLTSVN